MTKTKTARDGTTYTEYYNYKGQLHNKDGPAVLWHDGSYEEYWINGKMVSFKTFKRLTGHIVAVYDYSSAVTETEDSINF